MAETNTDTKAPAKADAAPAPAAAKVADQAAKAADKAADAAPAKTAAAAAPKAKAARKPRKAAPAAAPRAASKTATKTATKTDTVAKAAARKTKQNLNQGTITMKNEANKVADRFQAVFGEANERAKTTIERNTRIAEELTELGRGNVEAVVASTKIAARGLETIGQEVAEFGRKSFEDASAALKGFAEVKSPTDFFRLQTEFARSQFDTLVAGSSRLSETFVKLAGDAAQPITSRYSVAAERVKNAVAA